VKLQILRRCVQLFAILVMFSLPTLSLYAHYRAARVIDDDQLMSGMRGEVVTKLIYPYVERLDDPQGFLDDNKGTFWSMRLFGLDLTDPLAAAEMVASSKRIHWPLLASIVIPVVLALLLGKVFCSWICPGYVLFEVTGKLRSLLRVAEIEPGRVTFSHRNKYVLLVAGLVVAGIASAPLFALIYPPIVISRAVHAWVFGTSLMGMVVLLGVMVGVELFVSPRWWCRTMCPGGALYGLLGWIRPVRVRLAKSSCTGCMDCVPVCDAGINPITQSSSIECDNCGVCIRHCEPGALFFAIGLPDELGKTKRSHRHGRVSKPAAVATLVLSVLMFASPASGHHILGLPHYSYKENYPQRPTLEYPATTGPYSVLLTSYPGIPTPGEPANLALYIKDQTAQRVYTKPITVRVLQTSTFGDNTIIMEPTTREPFDNEYKFHVTFPTDGEYIVELSIMVEGRVEVIPFLMVAGEPTATASVVVGGGFGVVFLFVVVRAIQKKKHRRAAGSVRPCTV
jgi:ferredoxin-type protein NapH